MLTDLLVQYGVWGMFLSAILAGSVFPFSSEAVMIALLAMGVDSWELIIWGTAGNVLGSVINYGIGRLGREEWFEKYLHVSPESMDKARRFVKGRGAYMGFFAFIPLLGSAITILLGLMRANATVTFLFIFLGKIIRYILLVYGAYLVEYIVNLFI